MGKTDNFAIRPFRSTDAEYQAFATMQMAVLPEFPDTAEELRHRDEARDPDILFHRFVVEVDGEMVAAGEYGEPWWSMRPGKYYMNVLVHPHHQRQGIGTALYNHLWRLVSERNPTLVISNAREDRADSLRFLADRGFEQIMRFQISHLDVPRFDPAPFASILANVANLGIQILTLAEVAVHDEEWMRKLWDLEWELLQDVPSPEPLTRLSFENWQEQAIKSPSFNPEGVVVALDKGRWVGMSGLWMAQGDRQKLYTGLTGVVRSHRRKGIAMAMKVQSLDFAKRYGAMVVETENEENNPMYLLNLQLGFAPQPAWLAFEKKIEQG